jgi:hypothetical protein
MILNKIPASLKNNQVHYHLQKDDKTLILNDFIGKKIRIQFKNILTCLDCKKNVSKFYGQGLCYVCTMSSPMNSPCIINPELCEAHLGNGRDVEWEKANHIQPHIVYLANSGGLKVGVTRADQIPTRWIDQGADEVIILANTPYRQLAGQIEVFLKQYLSDKTNWRVMLKNEKIEGIDLLEAKKQYGAMLPTALQEYISDDDTCYHLNFPTQILSKTVKSVKLDKLPILEGILTGIKGQYLILDGEQVINIRSHSGYNASIDFE